jgi:hypothetical protein
MACHQLRGGLELFDPIIFTGLLAATFGSDVASGASSAFAYATSDPPPPVLLNSIIAAVLLATAVKSGVGLIAFSVFTFAGPDLPPLELLDSVIVAVLLAATLGYVVGVADFLAPTCSAMDPLPPESCTDSVAVVLGACYPTDVDSKTELPSLRINLLFFSRGQSVRSTPWLLGMQEEGPAY